MAEADGVRPERFDCPGCAWPDPKHTSQSVTVEDSISVAHASKARLPSPSQQARSGPAIIAGIARAVPGGKHGIDRNGMVGDDDRCRGVFVRRDVVFLNADHLRERGLSAGEQVDVHAAPVYGAAADPDAVLRGLTAVAYDIPKVSAGARFPEANVLIPLARHDGQSGTPSYTSAPVKIVRSGVR